MVMPMDFDEVAQQIYRKAIRVWGEEHQEQRVLEEMNELAIEILKKGRGKRDRIAMASEVADVLNTIDQLIIIEDIAQIVSVKRIEKLMKLVDEIQEETEKRGADD